MSVSFGKRPLWFTAQGAFEFEVMTMTELELLESIYAQLDKLIFLGQAVVIGLQWIGAAAVLAGFLFARRDSIF